MNRLVKIPANAFSRLRKAAMSSTASVSSSSAAAPETYSTGVQIMHWTMGGALMGSVAYVLLAQNTEDKAVKGRYMFLHKSCGLLAAGLLLPRLFIRATSLSPGPLKGPITKIEEIASKISHAALYGLMIVLPVTGVSMGYFSGFGLPFFFTTIPGASKEDKRPDISKQAFGIHKLAGQALEYLVPLHIFAALGHVARGHGIFSRILSVTSKK